MSKDNKTETFDLNKHTFRLLQQEPFFASLSRRIPQSTFKTRTNSRCSYQSSISTV